MKVRKDRTKVCIICRMEYPKDSRVSLQQWGKQKTCSVACRAKKPAWNKGLKKTQPANKGSFKKGEHRHPSTEFDGTYAGSLHWNWKGGITPKSISLRTGAKNKKWRKAVFARDDYTCQVCHARGVILNADHIKPFSLYPDLRFDINNGRTLCVDCHKQTDTYAGKVFKYVEA